MKLRNASLRVAVLAAAGMTAPANAVPGGELHVLTAGRWLCEQPGDAIRAPVRLPADDFWAIPDSSYRTGDGEIGSYLLLAERLVMTSGPFEGRSYVLESPAMAHPLDSAGRELAIRCVKSGTPSAYVDPVTAATDTPVPPPATN